MRLQGRYRLHQLRMLIPLSRHSHHFKLKYIHLQVIQRSGQNRLLSGDLPTYLLSFGLSLPADWCRDALPGGLIILALSIEDIKLLLK
jgi:hypothetical protein